MARMLWLAALAAAVFPSLSVRAADVPLEKLVAAISGADAEAALQAIDAVDQRGEAAKIAVTALSRALSRPDVNIRWRAARALGAIGPAAAAAVPALTQALADEVPQVRAYAAFALGRIGKAAEPATEKLIVLVFDKEVLVRRAALRAMRQIGPPQEKTLPIVEKLLQETDRSLILPALETLAEAGKEAVPRLRVWLKNKTMAHWACVVLAELGPDAADAVPDLIPVLKAEEPETRLQALIALGNIGVGAQSAAPAVVELLEKDPFEGVRYAAVYALVQLGQRNEAVNAALAAAAEHKDPLLKLLGIWGLARLNPTDEQLARAATEAIVADLQSKNEQLRRAAARALCEFHGPPELVRPALLAALKDGDPEVVGHVLDALAALGPQALPKIENALQNKEVRHFATRVIHRLGANAAPAVPALVAALQQPVENEDDAMFRKEVQLSLAAIGPAAQPAVPELIKSLDADDQEIRGTACYALGKIGPDARDAARPLVQKIRQSDEVGKTAMVWALLQIVPRSERLVAFAAPLLIEALNSDREVVRAEAASALGDLGDPAKPAVPRLKQLLEDESPMVRKAAAAALKKLGVE